MIKIPDDWNLGIKHPYISGSLGYQFFFFFFFFFSGSLGSPGPRDFALRSAAGRPGRGRLATPTRRAGLLVASGECCGRAGRCLKLKDLGHFQAQFF